MSDRIPARIHLDCQRLQLVRPLAKDGAHPRAERLAPIGTMIGHLALEVQFRGVGIGELMTQLIVAAIEKDIFKAILDENSGAEIFGSACRSPKRTTALH